MGESCKLINDAIAGSLRPIFYVDTLIIDLSNLFTREARSRLYTNARSAYNILGIVFTARKRSLGQGNVLHMSVYSRGSAYRGFCIQGRGVCIQGRGVCIQGRGVCIQGRGVCILGGWAEKRAVRILLECFLIHF